MQRKKMKQQDYLSQHIGPVVIGGVGGSGTSLIAQILKEVGFHIGTDLNGANDNLWFTLLFKRIEIISSSEEEFDELLRIFFTGMTGSTYLTKHQVSLIKALASKDRKQHSAHWLEQRAKTLLSEKVGIKAADRWGWKEPNSHIVLNRLVDRIENMKYIQVVRNGLDMAHSRNQNQLSLWGAHFINEKFEITPYYSLKYWCIVHKRALDIGKSMGDNFLFLNYDDLCINPEKTIKQLFGFLGLEIDLLMPQLIALVSPPNSMGRFKSYGTDIFSKEDLVFVKSLGFDISSS